MTRSEELRLGRGIAAEVPAMVREMRCKPCGIGAAIVRVEKRHGISPTFDWQGEAARKAGHKCELTIWDKRPDPPHWSDREVGADDDAPPLPSNWSDDAA